MKWLLTVSPAGEAPARYVAWVKQRGVDSDTLVPTAGAPADLGAYSALLLTGGDDVNPARYGEAPAPETAGIIDARDALELQLIECFLHLGKPVFGVCRGLQILNVALGGKLIQHIPALLGGREIHRMDGAADPRHAIRFQGGSALAQALRGIREVNSTHHQAVAPTAVGHGLHVTAVSPAGIIEAVEGQGLPSAVLAIQWHPERLEPADPAASQLLDLMIRLCGPGSRGSA